MGNKAPFVQAALLCERVLRETDGVITAVRIVDTYYLEPKPPHVPDDWTGVVDFTVLVMLKSGDLEGTYEIDLNYRPPEGQKRKIRSAKVLMKGGTHGPIMVTQIQLEAKALGINWIDVVWQGEVLTSIPFRLLPAESSPRTVGSAR